MDAIDPSTARHSLFAFEQMLEQQPLRECTYALRSEPGVRVGVRDGQPFGDEASLD